MVVFICGSCGDSIKKNVVDKHWQTVCRNRPPLSCIDCGLHFTGESFRTHNACMTEQEKWHGKDFKPKEGNTGKKKQDTWMENIQEAIAGAQGKNPRVNTVLQRLLSYDNVPRKESKFKNFLANCLRISDHSTVSTIWSIVSAVKPVPEVPKPAEIKTDVSKESEVTKVNGSVNGKTEKRNLEEESLEEPSSKKPKTSEVTVDLGDIQNDQEDGSAVSVSKFKWKKAIKTALSESKKGSLKRKKLQRKVINGYSAHHSMPFQQTPDLIEKFDKYLSKHPDLFLIEDKTVKLVQIC